MTTLSWYAELALRRRVSMSAMGSVIVMDRESLSRRGSPAMGPAANGLPGGLAHAGQLARVCHVPDADAAETELAQDGARPAALLAAGVAPDLELRLRRGLDDESLLGHLTPP